MLPHKLSNGICSLNPNVDRLSLSCLMEIDKKGKVISHEICESVINIDKRMTYTIVNDLLTNENSKYLQENENLMPIFKNMQDLRDILLKKRIKRGAIEFDFKESKIILDEQGNPIKIEPYERNVATSIIEEFMLVANETVAEHFFWLDIPFVYRSHQEPEVEKIEKLSNFILKFGYSIKGSTIHSKAFQSILKKSKNTPQDLLINKIILRSLKQARYTFKNESHFGLAAKYYCHFTSPIRRYPDLQIHRIIKLNINNKLDANKINSLNKKLPDVCKNCSLRERIAEDAERETIRLKKAKFMQDKIGQVFTGIISYLTVSGIYVELENTIEGMINVKNIYDDYYFFDEINLQYIGERTKKIYTIGDVVNVKVINVDIQNKNIDFEFFDDELE